MKKLALDLRGYIEHKSKQQQDFVWCEAAGSSHECVEVETDQRMPSYSLLHASTTQRDVNQRRFFYDLSEMLKWDVSGAKNYNYVERTG